MYLDCPDWVLALQEGDCLACGRPIAPGARTFPQARCGGIPAQEMNGIFELRNAPVAGAAPPARCGVLPAGRHFAAEAYSSLPRRATLLVSLCRLTPRRLMASQPSYTCGARSERPPQPGWPARELLCARPGRRAPAPSGTAASSPTRPRHLPRGQRARLLAAPLPGWLRLRPWQARAVLPARAVLLWMQGQASATPPAQLLLLRARRRDRVRRVSEELPDQLLRQRLRLRLWLRLRLRRWLLARASLGGGARCASASELVRSAAGWWSHLGRRR